MATNTHTTATATRITPDHPALNLGVDSDGLRCTRCEHPHHRRGICPTCGCDNYRKNNPK
jgi:hypothetical protein